MGYTHYWTLTRDPTEAEFEALREAARQIIGRCEIPLANGDGEPGTMPELTETEILFNGVGEDCGEGFYLSKNRTDMYQHPETGNLIDWCKTHRFPYDAVVVAVLLAAKRALGDAIEVSSSGLWDEWVNGPHDDVLGGAAIYKHIFGEDPGHLMKDIRLRPVTQMEFHLS